MKNCFLNLLIRETWKDDEECRGRWGGVKKKGQQLLEEFIWFTPCKKPIRQVIGICTRRGHHEFCGKFCFAFSSSSSYTRSFEGLLDGPCDLFMIPWPAFLLLTCISFYLAFSSFSVEFFPFFFFCFDFGCKYIVGHGRRRHLCRREIPSCMHTLHSHNNVDILYRESENGEKNKK